MRYFKIKIVSDNKPHFLETSQFTFYSGRMTGGYDMFQGKPLRDIWIVLQFSDVHRTESTCNFTQFKRQVIRILSFNIKISTGITFFWKTFPLGDSTTFEIYVLPKLL